MNLPTEPLNERAVRCITERLDTREEANRQLEPNHLRELGEPRKGHSMDQPALDPADGRSREADGPTDLPKAQVAISPRVADLSAGSSPGSLSAAICAVDRAFDRAHGHNDAERRSPVAHPSLTRRSPRSSGASG